MQQPIFLTAEGIENLRQELDYLVNVRRPELARILRKAIQQGDLSENADYIAAKEEQAFLEGRIRQIETMLRYAVVIESDGPEGVVRLGSRVTVMEEGRDEPEVFQIVGPAEADPLNGKVSDESPLGRALLGCRVGDVVTVDAPAGRITFQVLDIK